MINLAEDRILDFLDGRLATPDEEELLHTLAVSPERRQVMREHMKLREVTSSIARQDRFAVPEYVTDQLFSKLEDMGFSAPVSTEALLSRTPEYVSVAGAAAVATAVGNGWRIGAMSLLTASIMSFILGAGAYYVFGSSLGLRTRSEELAARHHAITRHYASVASSSATPQFDVALAEPVSHNAAKVINNAAKNGTGSGANMSSINNPVPIEYGFVGPIMGEPIAITSDNSDANAGSAIPISYTAPVKTTYSATVTAPQPLTDILPFWPSVIPSPLEKEQGRISVQYSAGPGPQSTSVQWNQLAEFKVSFTLWGYFVGAASMGELSSFERVAQGTLQQNVKVASTTYPIAYVVNTSTTTANTTTLMGLEGGITLDRMGIPIVAMGGFMFSGSQFYDRLSLMMHFDPLEKMTISAGIQALFYNHPLPGNLEKSTYPSSPYPTVFAPGSISSLNETCGLVGPSIQIGWHF